MAKQIALITGITGMVGSHLTDYLLQKTDWQIFGLCRWRSPLDNLAHLTPLIEKGERLFLEYGDLRDYHSIHAAIEKVKPDYVFHLAAQSYPKTSFDSPLDTFETNIQGTANLLEALKKVVSQNPGYMCVLLLKCLDEFPVKSCRLTRNVLFIQLLHMRFPKVGTDLVGRFYAEAYDMRVITTRMFTHTGPRRGDVFAESSFAKQIAMIEAGQIAPILKTGNLRSLRTFMM